MDYPAQFLKGIPNKDAIDSDGNVSSNLFHFRKPILQRGDGFEEDSINWNDDSDAQTLTMNQTKDDGSLQFKIGVAICSTEEIKRLRHRPLVKDNFNFERRPLEANPYHGNLLLKETVSTPVRRRLAAWLTVSVDEIVFRQ